MGDGYGDRPPRGDALAQGLVAAARNAAQPNTRHPIPSTCSPQLKASPSNPPGTTCPSALSALGITSTVRRGVP